ncbi:uncharacterized [Tachysurus ichikawai]
MIAFQGKDLHSYWNKKILFPCPTDTNTPPKSMPSAPSTFILYYILRRDDPGGSTLSIIPSSDRYNCIALGLWA